MTNQKSGNPGNEYFAREDAEQLRKLHAEEQARLQAHELAALKAAHQGRETYAEAASRLGVAALVLAIVPYAFLVIL